MKPLNPTSPHMPTTFGTASFMRKLEAIKLKLNERGEGKKLCPYVGAIAESNAAGEEPIPLYARSASSMQSHRETELREGSGHLLTVAPTRAGKGTGQIIPNLLGWQGSALIVDIKGENYRYSAGFRASEMKQKVLRFAPFEKESEIWNPIMSIRANVKNIVSTPEEEEDARYLTNLLIAPSGSSEDVFWENSAKSFLEGLLLHVRTAPLKSDNLDSDDPKHQFQVRERSMREVRRLLSLSGDAFDLLLVNMGLSKRNLIRQAGNSLSRLISGEGKTGQSILAMALEKTAVWAYERLHRVTYKPLAASGHSEPSPNDFSFSQMRDGNTSIYLIIPPDYLTEYRAVLRVMIGFAMRELRHSYVQCKKDPQYQDKPPILFVLDEFPQLAHMNPIEEALLYLAGYGVRFWFFVQDVSQLQLHYKDSWRTFFANTGTQCFFGVSDIATANLVSEMTGTATVDHRSFTAGQNESKAFGTSSGSNSSHTSGGPHSTSTSGSSSGTSYTETYGTNASATVAYTARRLITPDEVMRMHDEEQIVFMKGLKPLRCNRIPYYESDEFFRRSNIEPPKEVDFE